MIKSVSPATDKMLQHSIECGSRVFLFSSTAESLNVSQTDTKLTPLSTNLLD